MKKLLRPVLTVLFLAMLAVPLVMRRLRAPEETGGADPLARYGFRLTESAGAAGLQHVHEAPTLDPKLAHIMPQVSSMGAAVSVVDFDRDGHADLYVTTAARARRTGSSAAGGTGPSRRSPSGWAWPT
jgi:hypothetical protein